MKINLVEAIKVLPTVHQNLSKYLKNIVNKIKNSYKYIIVTSVPEDGEIGGIKPRIEIISSEL